MNRIFLMFIIAFASSISTFAGDKRLSVQRASDFEELPTEIIFWVTKYLDKSQILVLSMTSKKMDAVWREQFNMDWKEIYFEVFQSDISAINDQFSSKTEEEQKLVDWRKSFFGAIEKSKAVFEENKNLVLSINNAKELIKESIDNARKEIDNGYEGKYKFYSELYLTIELKSPNPLRVTQQKLSNGVYPELYKFNMDQICGNNEYEDEFNKYSKYNKAIELYNTCKQCLNSKNMKDLLVMVDLPEVDFSGLCFPYIKMLHVNLRDAKFIQADFSNAQLTGSDLSGADLTRVIMVSVKGRKIKLIDAVLNSADLRGADLRGADLTRADLTRVDLAGADLRGTDLSNVLSVAGANLSNIKWSAETKWPKLDGAFFIANGLFYTYIPGGVNINGVDHLDDVESH